MKWQPSTSPAQTRQTRQTHRQRVKPGFVILSAAFVVPALMFLSTIVRLVLGIGL